MSREQHYMSKVPPKLILLFLVNLILIIGLEVLLIYRYPAKLDTQTLASFDDSYEDCTILQAHQRGYLWCYLVQTQEGEIRLIPVRTHSIFFNRGRIYDDQIVTISEDIQETVFPVKLGLHTSTVTVSSEPMPNMLTQEPSDLYMAISSAASGDAATVYMLLAAVLELAELFVIYKIKGTV